MYASKVKGQELNFAVSGMLWQRSLVMIDGETKTLWSHILGKAMRGKLKGVELESIPSVITDWKSWKERHPDTTVLDMSRTARDFTRNFYTDKDHFVVGLELGDAARAWGLDSLAAQPVINDVFEKQPLVVFFDETSTATTIFDRRLGDQVLEFELDKVKVFDRKTKSEWDLVTGKCLAGSHRGKQLDPVAAILSFSVAWKKFHPKSSYWTKASQ